MSRLIFAAGRMAQKVLRRRKYNKKVKRSRYVKRRVTNNLNAPNFKKITGVVIAEYLTVTVPAGAGSRGTSTINILEEL